MNRTNSKAELLGLIESQKEQLHRYETRLRDVVSAYKNLTKEKDALQASITAMCGRNDESNEPSNSTSYSDDLNVVANVNEKLDFVDPLHATVTTDEKNVPKLQDQVQTLSQALSTLTQNKSAVEANFQADKKRMIKEYELAELEFEQERSDKINMIQQLETELKQQKALLRNEQYEREKETSDFASKIKHMQQLLFKEQKVTEKLEHEVETLEARLNQYQEKTAQDIIENAKKDHDSMVHDSKVAQYEEELCSLKKDLEQSKYSDKQAHLEQQKLISELAKLKNDQTKIIEKERSKVKEGEERIKVILNNSEDRVLSLESKVSELSSLIGSYEKIQQDDQLIVHRLKDRIHHLELEKQCASKFLNDETDDAKLGLVNSAENNTSSNISVLKSRLQALIQASAPENPIRLIPLLKGWGFITKQEENELHKGCREEINQILDDFEAYKRKIPAPSIVPRQDTTDSNVVNLLNAEISDLKEKVKAIQFRSEEEHNSSNLVIANLHQQLIDVGLKWKDEIEKSDSEQRQKLTNLTYQMQKQRERTIQLIAEKEKEVEALQNTVSILQTRLTSNHQPTIGIEGDSSGNATRSENQFSMTQLSSPSGKLDCSNPMIHYVEELARCELDISNMRKVKFQLESALRELQLSGSAKEERYVDQMDLLKEEVRKLERNKSRESANLEYLKNVIISWIQCHNQESKAKMMNAIATILHFSPKERESVLKAHSSWWGPTRTGNSQT